MPAEPTLPTGPLLVVSPELGDVALSCAALLARVDPVTVLDVFTLVPEPDRATDWDRSCGFASAHEAMAAHEREEADAYNDSFHEVLAVDLLSRRYRDELRGAADERRLADALIGWVARSGSCTVALPAGAGLVAGTVPAFGARVRGMLGGRRALYADPDHLWVRDTAAQILAAHPAVSICLYEELPHALSRRAGPAVELFAGWTQQRAELHVLRVDRHEKAGRLMAYSSQVPMWFRARTVGRLAKRVPPTERYWWLAGSLRSGST
jgi:hypothetical protein